MQRWISRGSIGLVSLGLAATSAIEPQAATQVAGAPAPSSAEGLVSLARDLTLTVAEDGPNQPWTVTLANTGKEPLGFIADPGLLWFDVSLPGRPIQSCRLPEPLRPSSMERKSVLVLAPGEQYSRRFDPRFFCFAELGQILLVPRAKVTPHFGWQREPGADGRPKPVLGSKRTARTALADAGSFVAWRLTGASGNPPPTAAPQPVESDDPDSGGAGPAWRMPTEGLNSVQGATLELADAYASWIGSTRHDPRDMELVMLAGSDAEDERNATVAFGVVNSLDRPQHIFVRRELLEYDVQGPDGYFECPSSDVGSPDFASFSSLPPHGADRAVVRLLEICPRRSFARPGLYEVRARFVARWSGHDLGLDAFVGRLETPRPAFVRVRSGDRSSFARLVVPPATPGAAPAPAAAQSGPDSPPADDTPDNPSAPDSAPGAPEQVPAPETPPVE